MMLLAFVILCFTLGTLSGYYSREKFRYLFYFSDASQKKMMLILLLAVGVATLAIVFILSLGLSSARFTAFCCISAALLVGWMAGGWWADAATASGQNIRERIIALAAVGLLIVLTAANYELNFFSKISHLTIGTVNFDLVRTNVTANVDRSVARLEGQRAAGLPRTAAIDDALLDLVSLPNYIGRDELYAAMFAGRPLDINKPDALVSLWSLDPQTAIFREYACSHIREFGNKLQKLQKYHRAESSILSVNPRMIEHLRTFYDISSQIHDIKKGILKEAGDINLGKLRANIKEISIQIGKGLGDGNEDLKIQTAAIPPEEKSTAEKKQYSQVGACLVPDQTSRLRSDFLLSESFDAREKPNSNYIGYLGLFTSIAEVGIGHVESAIQLLHQALLREIQTMVSYPDSTIGPRPDGACKSSGETFDQDCIQALRKRMLVLRLLAHEANLMASAQTKSLRSLGVDAWEEFIGQADRLLSLIDPGRSLRNSFFKKDLYDQDRASCSAPSNNLNKAFDWTLFSRLVFQVVSAQNSAVALAAENEESLAGRSERGIYLDAFARTAATYDIDCAVEAKVIESDDADSTQVQWWESAGSYYLKRGELAMQDVGPTSLKLSQGEQAELLCKSIDLFARAASKLANFGDRRVSDNGSGPRAVRFATSKYEDNIEARKSDVYLLGIEAKRRRAIALLDELPAATQPQRCHR